jgi:hypothetical protein
VPPKVTVAPLVKRLPVIVTLVPIVGTWLVAVPGVLYLFATGHVALAIGLLIWSAVLVNLAYNLITPQFVRRKSDIHPYIVLLSVLGGIGFFLGGIGPDGHIGFNVRGSDHFSTTRLLPINFETAAAAAPDLGGIEEARHKVVLSIGLSTIARNPSVTAIPNVTAYVVLHSNSIDEGAETHSLDLASVINMNSSVHQRPRFPLR